MPKLTRYPIASSISGNTSGLSSQERHGLERIYRRKLLPEDLISFDLAAYMLELSQGLNRQVAILVDRQGSIQQVMVGDYHSIFIPELGRQRGGKSRLRALRLIHTHLGGEWLNQDDKTDLLKLQLDAVVVLQREDEHAEIFLEWAHLEPGASRSAEVEVHAARPFRSLDVDFSHFIDALERRFSERSQTIVQDDGQVRAIAVCVTPHALTSKEVERDLEELKELAYTAGVRFLDVIMQRRPKPDPRYVIGQGKLEDLALSALYHDADLVVFQEDLSPSQIRSIADKVELKVIDRTQLILDIFAQRATSRDGKLQVELAQLKYTLPRLSGHGTAMSRLAGGVGGRGPGETKLELDRRRAKDRIAKLEKELEQLGSQRAGRRQRRQRAGLGIAALVGYTNAGKSTLLNTLTGATVFAEDKLFATLDPTARRLRFPNEVEFVLTDTVGFIRDLPKDLKVAFMATLEELGEADVLIHVVDRSQEGYEDRISAVRAILEELKLHEIPEILVFNKLDLCEEEEVVRLSAQGKNALCVSAKDKATLRPLTDALMLHYEKSRIAKEKAQSFD